MKLIIQIPCFNEAESLPVAFADLPKHINGITSIETLIIDDGSTDATVEVAEKLGVNHIVRLTRNSGLAKAFMAGIDACLSLGADIIVNTDADNQYCALDIPLLVAPVLMGSADIVIGARPIMTIAHFSPVKKLLQRIGSIAVRYASNTSVEDAPSGFRAFSRAAAQQLHVFSAYTYTLETIIASGQKGFTISSVPIRVNGDLRPSRLVKSVSSYVRKSLVTIVRMFIIYRPFRFLSSVAMLFFIPGFLLAVRYIYILLSEGGEGHIQSLILAAILLVFSGILGALAIIADLNSINRKLLESVSFRLRLVEEQLVSNRRSRP
jgi:glycosyltransferase involved in cell wall biosynthesis